MCRYLVRGHIHDKSGTQSQSGTCAEKEDTIKQNWAQTSRKKTQLSKIGHRRLERRYNHAESGTDV